MRTRYALQRNTIRSRLWFGFGTIVLLLAVAGVVVRASFSGISDTITASLVDVQVESSLAGQLSADIAKTIEAGIAIAIEQRGEQENAAHPPALSDHRIAVEQEPI